MTFKKSEYDGLDTKRMIKDLNKLTKQYIKMGNDPKRAADQAKSMIAYNIHQYRMYS